MRTLLALLLMTGTAMAWDYPTPDQMAQRLSILNSATRSCGLSRAAFLDTMEQARVVALVLEYDWARIKRNALSHNYNPSKKLCKDAGQIQRYRNDYMGLAE